MSNPRIAKPFKTEIDGTEVDVVCEPADGYEYAKGYRYAVVIDGKTIGWVFRSVVRHDRYSFGGRRHIVGSRRVEVWVYRMVEKPSHWRSGTIETYDRAEGIKRIVRASRG